MKRKIVKKMKFPAVVLIVILSFIFIGSCHSAPKKFQSADELEPLPQGEKSWNKEIDGQSKSLINPPKKIPFLTGIFLGYAEKEFKKELLPGRILAWEPDMGVASGYLEYTVETEAAKVLDKRLVYLIRMAVSYRVPCAFVIDVNSWEYKKYNINSEELDCMKGLISPDKVRSFSKREVVAVEYALAMSNTPVVFTGELLDSVRKLFSREEIVAISVLAAKVNYWARLIEAWRIKPAHYSDESALEIEKYNTYSDK